MGREGLWVLCGVSVPAVTLVVMPRVMAVTFEQYGRLHYLDPDGGDYRVGDQVLYPTDDGAEVQVEQVGELPEGLTFVQRENGHQTWDAKAKAWILPPDVAARLKAEQQDEVWERIKAKRYDNLRHGVYAKSVGKWFQTDDATRLQYLALALESVTGGFKKPINWKTMDNSFLMLTPELLREIMQTMHDDEQADFANAEKHKAAMLQTENPMEYDYSGGWTANFDEQPAAELEEAAK